MSSLGKTERPISLGSDAESLLGPWCERVLSGVIITSMSALLPAWAIHSWQAHHGIAGAQSGLWVVLAAILALGGLGLWQAPYRLRAALLIGLGFAVVVATLFGDGFSPAQCVLVCLLTTVCALLYSTRVAAAVLAACMLCMAGAAYLFNVGLLRLTVSDQLDVTNPLNWLRVGLYTSFASATAAVASGYLLERLRQTVNARATLIAQLQAEVAERTRAHAQLESTQAQLLQAHKLEAIGQLAAGIAHDFNNTLSIVTLEAGLLTRTQQSDAVRRTAESLLGAAERGRQLTQQLLLFSRPPSSEQSVIDGARTFDECVAALRRLLPSEITFELDIAPEPMVLRMQASELQQIVLNLGINARDAMTGGGRLRLTLASKQLVETEAGALGLAVGGYALLSCSDTGCGMSTATLARAFEPFFSTKGPGRGTGLGLTNVWNIASRAGGKVHVTSSPGAGTTLRVYLPLRAVSPRSLETLLATHAPWRGQETVLVVEDDLRIRALLVSTLSDAGYRVLDAANVDAALALEQAHAGPIDIVCTDAVMPGRQARELLAELRVRRPSAGILVCSGYSEDEQIARGIQRGEFQRLDKPFTRGQLLAAVRATLERRDALG